MFRKKIKKEFPPGTFIETPVRVMAILQLCLVFTVILWNGSKPFMGEHFAVKSRLLVVENVMAEENQEFFTILPEAEKEMILSNYRFLKQKMEAPFSDKLKRAVYDLAVRMPGFERLWIVLGIAIPILLLKKVEGARLAVWLLPAVTLFYCIDNYYYALPQKMPMEASLFPKEQQLVDRYLEKPLSANILEQREQLLLGWKRYLVTEWALEKPQSEVFDKQVRKGEFAFNVARIALQQEEAFLQNDGLKNKFTKDSLFLLLLYVLWNFALAGLACRRPILPASSLS